jgi:hypothetical protein
MTALHEVMLTVKGVITDNKHQILANTDINGFPWLDLSVFKSANPQRSAGEISSGSMENKIKLSPRFS